MQNNIEALRARMASLNNEYLIKIVTEDANAYEVEAIQIAKEELELRKISIEDTQNKKHFEYIINNTDFDISNLIVFSDIVHQTDYSLVEEAIYSFYPTEKEFASEYKGFYNLLLQLKPTESSDVLIFIENQLLDIDDSQIEEWEVVGRETKSGYKLDLELFSWEQWLSFFVNSTDLQVIGTENYLALCFYKMTINGFNEAEIKENLEIKAEVDNFSSYLYETGNPNSSGITHDNVLKTVTEFKSKIISLEVPQIRPWVRFCARMLDNNILSLILLIIMKYLTPLQWNMQILGVTVTPFIQAIIESILLSTWGTTPGKWILRVNVLTLDGNKLSYKQSLYRSTLVWLFGEAASLNILNTFTYLISYFRLTNIGNTYWDEKGQFSVTHERIGVLRCIVFVILIFVITSLVLRISLTK